jgi:dephospho-CoA kinase
MLKIGITGGIGSGKSTISKLFQLLGIPVYQADERAKWLITNSLELKTKIIDLMGSNAYLANGTYNRTWVAQQVFDNKILLEKLNSLVHPEVRKDTVTWFLKNQNQAFVLYEAALMNKAKHENELDAVISVTAPIEVRIQRILKRDRHRTEEDIRKIIQHQKSDAEFSAIANYQIQNGTYDLVIPQVLKIIENLNNN